MSIADLDKTKELIAKHYFKLCEEKPEYDTRMLMNTLDITQLSNDFEESAYKAFYGDGNTEYVKKAAGTLTAHIIRFIIHIDEFKTSKGK